MMEKVNEAMKANGKRELSMDELDKVVGGSYTYGTVDGVMYISINGMEPLTLGQFCDMMYTMAESFGIDVALRFLKDGVGFTCSEMGSGRQGMSDKAYMEVVMAHFAKALQGSGY